MLKKRLPSVKGRKPYIRYHLLQHTLRNRIYMSSFNARKRRHLQISRCSGRDSEVIFHSFLLIPDFHHLRLALTFQNCVLSSSTSLKLSNCLYYNSQNRALSSIISTKPPFLCIFTAPSVFPKMLLPIAPVSFPLHPFFLFHSYPVKLQLR